MTTIKITADQLKLLETLGNIVILGSRKAIFVPYIFIRNHNQPADEFELILIAETMREGWEDFQRLILTDVA